MKTIDVRELVIEERQRTSKPIENVKNLAASIKQVGLLQPAVLRDDNKTLVIGETRSRAIEMLGNLGVPVKFGDSILEPYHLPYYTTDEADIIILQQMELFENTMRFDLTWQDKDAAVLLIKAMLQLREDGHTVTNRDVAKKMLAERGKDPELPENYQAMHQTEKRVTQAELRQKFADHEGVKGAKSASEADKIIKRELEREKRERLAKDFKEAKTEHVIAIGDCCELIKSVPSNSFDIICSDPIYGISADEMHMFQRRKHNADGNHHLYDDSLETWDRMFSIMPKELFRVCREQAAVYLFCDISRFHDFWGVRPGNSKPSKIKGLVTRFQEAGFDVWPRPLIWYKGNIGSLPKPEHGPRYTFECIIFATKGEKKTTGVYHDVINISQVTGHDHGAGKPPAVYHDLLRRSVNPGDSVLDFCAGSFPILPAANELDCKVTAWEIDGRWEKEAHLLKGMTMAQWDELRKGKLG
jgi:DNA modification methylase